MFGADEDVVADLAGVGGALPVVGAVVGPQRFRWPLVGQVEPETGLQVGHVVRFPF
jgi:hypothetical protein